jgi:ubiquitin C-terminal hydrolase
LFSVEPFLSGAQEKVASLFSQSAQTQLQNRQFTQVSGLFNLGCTCYLNAVIQQLCSHTLFFLSFMQSAPGATDLVALQRLFVQMRFGDERAVDPREYCAAYASRRSDFSPYTPQDAGEFFQGIVNDMPDSAVKLFRGTTRTEFRTLHGHELDVVDAPFLSLDLDVMQSHALPESIRQLCERETLHGENRFFDTRSGQKVDAVFSMTFVQAPQILVCHLRRFGFDSTSSTRQKIDDRFEFGFDLTLPNVNAMYALTGVVLHCGTADGGHYRSIVRAAGDLWLDIDDARVAELPPSAVLAESIGGFSRGWNAYLLFYTRADVLQQPIPRRADLPPPFRGESDADGGESQFSGLDSPPAIAFMRRVRSSALRFQYFLNVLCRSPHVGAAPSFADEVLGLPDEYAAHLREIVALVAENGALADVFLRILLSGVSDALLNGVAAVAELIAQKRETVEWFGRFLVQTRRERLPASAVLSAVAAGFPDRGDDLSGYSQCIGDSQFLPLFVQNDAFVEPAVAGLVQSGASWVEIQRATGGRRSEFELALVCLVAADTLSPPDGIERIVATPDFLNFCRQPHILRTPKVIGTLARRADLVFFPSLAQHSSKQLRKGTRAFIVEVFANQFNESPSVCLFRLINATQRLDALQQGDVGRYVQYFKTMHWLAKAASKDVKAFRGPLVRTQPKLLSSQAVFNSDLLHLGRLLIDFFALSADEFAALFVAFFRGAERFSAQQLRKALAAFLPPLERLAVADARAIARSNEFAALARRAALAGTPDAAQFLAFARGIAGG